MFNQIEVKLCFSVRFFSISIRIIDVITLRVIGHMPSKRKTSFLIYTSREHEYAILVQCIRTGHVVPRILVIVHARSIQLRSEIRSVVLHVPNPLFLFILLDQRTIVPSLRDEIEIKTESIDLGQLLPKATLLYK